jgi:hypothetical protein
VVDVASLIDPVWSSHKGMLVEVVSPVKKKVPDTNGAYIGPYVVAAQALRASFKHL